MKKLLLYVLLLPLMLNAAEQSHKEWMAQQKANLEEQKKAQLSDDAKFSYSLATGPLDIFLKYNLKNQLVDRLTGKFNGEGRRLLELIIASLKDLHYQALFQQDVTRKMLQAFEPLKQKQNIKNELPKE